MLEIVFKLLLLGFMAACLYGVALIIVDSNDK